MLNSRGYPIKGFVVAATGSGTGKTTISLAILSYLKSKGIGVAPFKVGPDFIDPGHHGKIAGRTSFNLDSWILSREYNQRLFMEKSKGMDLAVVEGVMGLFDGYDALSETGSTAQMAKWLNLPVVLIVNAGGKARSAAAIVKGFEEFDRDLNIAGVIFSQPGSLRHYEYLKDAVEQNCKTPCLGYMPNNEKIAMPERHLGLMTADELEISPGTISILVSMVKDHINMDRLIKNLSPLELTIDGSYLLKSDQKEFSPEDAPVIAVARDKAFCFYYQDNIEILQAAGARIINFSPLTDKSLPNNIDGIYLGGGYPEVFAKTLSTRTGLMAQIKAQSLAGMPIYGECGGLMYLSSQLSEMDTEASHEMTGCFSFSVQMSRRLMSLGYREITLTEDTIIGKKGDVLKGHEFHYSSLKELDSEDPHVKNVYHITTRDGQDITLKGFQKNNTLASYFHVHFGSNQGCAQIFVKHCAEFRKARLI